MLLKDAQATIEKLRKDESSRALIKQQRAQLEDTEAERDSALKTKRSLEDELRDAEAQLADAKRVRAELEERVAALSREKSEWSSRLEDAEVELSGLLKRYRLTVEQRSQEQRQLSEQTRELQATINERDALRTAQQELQEQLQTAVLGKVDAAALHTAEARARDWESRYELERSFRTRLEALVERLRDQLRIVEQVMHAIIINITL